MSPFCVLRLFLLALFFCFRGFFEKFLVQRPQERRFALGSTCDILVFFDPLAWTGAEPCGARRAERLGRRAGPIQRCSGYPPQRFLLHGAPGRLAPKVVRWRHPLPFRNGYRDACAHRFRPWRWLQRRPNLLPAKGTTAILDVSNQFRNVPFALVPHRSFKFISMLVFLPPRYIRCGTV